MAGGQKATTCIPKYGGIVKMIAPFGTTLDCDMWRGALGIRQMAQRLALPAGDLDRLDPAGRESQLTKRTNAFA